MENFEINKKIISVALAKEDEKPKKRAHILEGKTYKSKIPNKHSMYVTINDFEGKPLEIFINSIDIEHYQWMTALTRIMSAVFRKEDDLAFLVAELKAVVDPNGGFWKGGKYIPSIVHEIGLILEEHLNTEKVEEVSIEKQIKGSKCPSCGNYSLQKTEGCDKCLDCGYSKCG